MDLLWFVLIGLVAGWLAGQVMQGGGYGTVGDIVIGVLGAVVGGVGGKKAWSDQQQASAHSPA